VIFFLYSKNMKNIALWKVLNADALRFINNILFKNPLLLISFDFFFPKEHFGAIVDAF